MKRAWLGLALLLSVGCRCGGVKGAANGPTADPARAAESVEGQGAAREDGLDLPLGLKEAPGPIVTATVAPLPEGGTSIRDMFSGKKPEYPPAGPPTTLESRR